ncbi:hypothetical protein COT29_00610 [Candidatus Micrarchaeota archaeon CG08_land_8_20_14_0_20_59_11]|nr:MAG: hypothetical protein COT29_00610 [Candidatus Micrarchaeota archaeon CG08_land_8_20_14_0_20_59_11]
MAEKKCGICGKKLRKTQDRVAEGVFVDAFKCANGHVAYSEDVMRRVEAMEREHSVERHVVKVGSSLAVPIPAAVVRELGLRARETVFVKTAGNSIVIKPRAGAAA